MATAVHSPAQSSAQSPAHSIVPLPLGGNTTEKQNRLLQQILGEAVDIAYHKAIEQLDQQSADAVIESDQQLKSEIASRVFEVIERHTVTDKYRNEEVSSDRAYPPTYRVGPIEAQVSELRRLFPGLGSCQERLAHRELPEGAEDWFAIPRWQALAPTYPEAVAMVLGIFAAKRRVDNRIAGRLNEAYLRQTERAKLAEKILADQQQGNDVLVVAAQSGMLHRGSSVRRTRSTMAPNEFGLGVFAIACMLLTHPARLSTSDTLMMDCCGDEYSLRGDITFDRVPLFDYGMSGVEFSIFYDDRARDIWGSPTGFLYKLV